jgi:hypothetical protein
MVQTYANCGIGTIYSVRTIDISPWTLEEKTWHFELKPMIWKHSLIFLSKVDLPSRFKH